MINTIILPKNVKGHSGWVNTPNLFDKLNIEDLWDGSYFDEAR